MSSQSIANLVLFAAAVPAGVLAVRRRRVTGTSLGIRPHRRSVVDYLLGAALATAAIAAVWLVLLAAGLTTTHSGAPQAGTLFGVLGYLVVLAVVEEIAFRGLLLTGIAALTGRRWVAVAISSVLVAIPYLFGPRVTVLSFLSAVLAGVMYGTAFVVTGSVWTSAGMRAAWNFVQGPILGFTVSGEMLLDHPVLGQVPDGSSWLTGGEYGPEAGIVAVLARVAVIGVLLVLARHRHTGPLACRGGGSLSDTGVEQ